MESEDIDDMMLAGFGIAVVMMIFGSVVMLGICVPWLINMHNDGATIAAILLVLLVPATMFILARRLTRALRTYNLGE